MALVVTAADVQARIGEIETVLKGIDAVIASCGAGKLTDATRAQWSSFKTSWNAFVQDVQGESACVPFTGQCFATFNPYTVEAAIDNPGGWSDKANGWKKAIGDACGALVGPGPSPGPSAPGAKWSSGEVIAVSVAVSAVSAVALAGLLYARSLFR